MTSATPVPRPELAALRIADPPQRWEALGFTVADGVLALGGIELRLGAAGHGITAWTLRHTPVRGDVDGLPTGVTTDPVAPAIEHANGAVAIDQVVVTTPDFDRTAAALAQVGMPLRRIRDLGSFRQGFRRLGPAILELVEATTSPPGPARFWGLVVVVPDLVALRERLGSDLSEIRDAVQPGRHIASLGAGAGLSPRVAFMDPDSE